jgi:hypothetical protein
MVSNALSLLIHFPVKIFVVPVSPSDGDFVIGPCRLQRPGITAGNRRQQARDPGTQGVIRKEDPGPVSNSRRIPGSTHPGHERRAWTKSTRTL